VGKIKLEPISETICVHKTKGANVKKKGIVASWLQENLKNVLEKGTACTGIPKEEREKEGKR